MRIQCLLLEFILLFLVSEIEHATSTEEVCLSCWNNLCNRPGSSDDCSGNSCTDQNFGVLINDNVEDCCIEASSYVSTSVTNSSNLLTPPSNTNPPSCSDTIYNELTSPNDVESISVANSGKQYILYDTVRFDCSGCIKNVTIYTGVEILTTRTSMLQLWSTHTFNNQTVLTLKQEVKFDLFNGDSVDLPGNNFFSNTRDINGSFCFDPTDVFGIRMSSDLGRTVLNAKNIDGITTYARDVPSCESLENVYFVNSVDIVTNPIIAVGVTGPEQVPTEEPSTSSSMITQPMTATIGTMATSSASTTATSVSPVQPSTTVVESSATTPQSVTQSPLGSESTTDLASSSSSTSQTVIPSNTGDPVPPSGPVLLLYIGVAAGSVVFIVVLLVVIGLVVGVCLYVRAKSYINDVNGIEMMGHTGRSSVDDMLDFQTRTISPPGALGSSIIAGSAVTSQFSTPVHGNHTYQHPRPSFQQSSYYDDPTVLDTSKIDLSRSRDYLAESPDYTTMNSDIRNTPTNTNGSRSTDVSDNSYRKNLQMLQYDVPQPTRTAKENTAAYNEYDEPTALMGTQVGTLDPYAQSIELNGSHRVNPDRQYFVLDQDTMQRMTSNPQLPIYHVLERGYHVPSAQERGVTDISYETEKLNQQPFFEEQPHYWEPAEQTESIYDQLNEKKCRELRREDIALVEELGGGQFGTVWKGVWSLRGGAKKNVAVKVCKENVKEEEKARLLREGARMMQFFHTHVVQLFGIVTINEPICLVIELMTEGDLKEYLRSCRPDIGRRQVPPDHQLLKFCRDVASGMKHLAKKHFVHRDLAARNIMLNEKLVCKIGDFGMTRSSNHSYDLNKPEQVPLRWTAPEALKHRQYSEKSDVYSYGMLMFEIWSLGRNPFPLLEDNQLIINFISGGRIMPPPPGCPREMYRLMALAWHINPNERPSFESCYDFLSTDNESLLQWNSEDFVGLSQEVTELGANVQYGHDLYLDLQHQYRTEEY